MLHIPYDETTLPAAEKQHLDALISYIKNKGDAYCRQLFENITGVIPYDKSYENAQNQNEWDWLECFVLADVAILRDLASNAEKLQFEQFKYIYENRFSKSPTIYVDEKKTYNSYTFVKNLGIKVCPYCDKEYLDIVEQGGRERRTLELDHFFSKSVYPALAMCFYNLVPSGQGCNGLKSSKSIDKSPYEMDIESHTRLCPDLPIGVNMENVSTDECEIKFHPYKDMERNIAVFALESRYQDQKELAHNLLRKKQFYTDEKLAEMVRIGIADSVESAKRDIFGELPNPRNQILSKLRRDILE